jgi:hypothetical protein
MGRIDKGVNCSIQGCSQTAQRSMSGSKASMALNLDLDSTSKRIYLCKAHYREWKKASKNERENEPARWD